MGAKIDPKAVRRGSLNSRKETKCKILPPNREKSLNTIVIFKGFLPYRPCPKMLSIIVKRKFPQIEPKSVKIDTDTELEKHSQIYIDNDVLFVVRLSLIEPFYVTPRAKNARTERNDDSYGNGRKSISLILKNASQNVTFFSEILLRREASEEHGGAQISVPGSEWCFHMNPRAKIRIPGRLRHGPEASPTAAGQKKNSKFTSKIMFFL